MNNNPPPKIPVNASMSLIMLAECAGRCDAAVKSYFSAVAKLMNKICVLRGCTIDWPSVDSESVYFVLHNTLTSLENSLDVCEPAVKSLRNDIPLLKACCSSQVEEYAAETDNNNSEITDEDKWASELEKYCRSDSDNSDSDGEDQGKLNDMRIQHILIGITSHLGGCAIAVEGLLCSISTMNQTVQYLLQTKEENNAVSNNMVRVNQSSTVAKMHLRNLKREINAMDFYVIFYTNTRQVNLVNTINHLQYKIANPKESHQK